MPSIPSTGSPSDDTPPADERKRKVAHAWLAEHGGIPVRLQRDDVEEIAFRLVVARLHPTVEAIRLVNGGHGSPNVIHPALRDFYMSGALQRRWKRPSVPDVFSKSLLELWDRTLDASRQIADNEVAEQREMNAEVRQGLERERARLAEEERNWLEQLNAQEALVVRLHLEAAAARESVERLNTEVVQLREDRNNAQRGAGSDRKALVEAQAVRRELEARNQALEEQLRALNASLRHFAAMPQTNLTSPGEVHESSPSALRSERGGTHENAERDRLLEAIRGQQQRIVELEAELAAAVRGREGTE